MRCASALSTHPIASHATGDVISDVLESGAKEPALALVFVSPSLWGACEDIMATVQAILDPHVLLSVTSSGVIGAGSEVSAGSALALWVLWNDGSGTTTDVQLLPLDGGVEALGAISARRLREASGVVLLGDPAASDVTSTIDQACALASSARISGGLLSSSGGAAQIRGWSSGRHGVIALIFSERSMDSAIAHGSEPLSGTMIVSRSIGTMLCEIEDEAALVVAKRVIGTLDPREQPLAARNLAIAIHDPATGALLDVHRVLGADQPNGALAVTSEVAPGSLIAFHQQDRDGVLSGLSRSLGGPRSEGALVFSCTLINPESEREGAGELDELTETLGSSAFAGVHVSAIIGSGSHGSGLRAAPLSAAIFGRDHH